ncbi:MAG: glutamate mutase L, partial [bacterium]
MGRAILAVDCGSTTTKAILFSEDGGWHLVARGEAPTTVEA